MSIPVDIDDLKRTINKYGTTAYLVTANDDYHPHITHVAVSVQSNGLICKVGRKTSLNAMARPSVAMLWPPKKSDDHSLIVDGSMQVTETPDGSFEGFFLPLSAILHRPASTPVNEVEDECASDCLPISANND
jgi:hypothetical protein